MKILFLGVGKSPVRFQIFSFFPENYIDRNMAGHEIITFGYNSGVDIQIRPADDFTAVLGNLPAGWIPDFCLLWGLENNLLPLGLEKASFPIVAYVGDWDYDIALSKAFFEVADLVITIGDFESETVRILGAKNAATYYPQGIMKDNIAIQPKKIKERKYDIIYSTFIDDISHPDRSKWILRLSSLADKYKILITDPSKNYNEYIKLLQNSKLAFSTHRYGSTPNRILESGAQGTITIETGTEVKKYFLPDEDFIPVSKDNFNQQIDRYLNDEMKLQEISENINKKVAKNFDARDRFIGLIDFIGQKINQDKNKIIQTRKINSLNPSDKFQQRGEVLFYSFFRINLMDKNINLLHMSIWEFEKALSCEPSPKNIVNLAIALSSYGFLYNDNYYVEKSIYVLRNAISFYPEYLMAHYQLGLIFFRSGNNQDALLHFDLSLKLLKDDNSQFDPWGLTNRELDLFNNLLRKPLNSNLISLCKNEEIKSTHNLRSLYQSVIFYFIFQIEEKQGNIYRGLDMLWESYNLSPENGIILKDLANRLALLGFKGKSLFIYKKAIQLLPLNIDLRNEYVQQLYISNYDKELIAEMKLSIKIINRVTQLKEKSYKTYNILDKMERLNLNSGDGYDSAKETILFNWNETLFLHLRKNPKDLRIIFRIIEIWIEQGKIENVFVLIEDYFSKYPELISDKETINSFQNIYFLLESKCKESENSYSVKLKKFKDIKKKCE